MAGEIIRLGDRTSHSGTVIEGSQTDICMGKPIAFIGHKVYCPKCKGNFPIIEGVPTTTFYGKGVALAGMKTSCGAVLIAGQFTDTVEWGRSGGSSSARSAAPQEEVPSKNSVADVADRPVAGVSNAQLDTADVSEDLPYDEQFQLKDADGVVLADMPYTVTLPSGQRVHGTTDGEGRTSRYPTEGAQYIELCLGHIDS